MNPATLISVFYAVWFISVGISTPYLAPYLSGRGLSGTQIATVLSLIPLCNLGVPIAWAWIADRTHRHERVLRVVCFGSALGAALLLRSRDFGGVLLGYGTFALFSVGVGPLVDTLAVGLSHEGRGYGRVRIWGSFGFLIAAALGGLILTWRGKRPADPMVPAMMLAGLLAAGLASLFVKGHATPPPARPHASEIRTLLRDRRFRLLLVVGMLHWMALAPYNGFFGLLLLNRNRSPAVAGVAFALGVLAEGAILFWFANLRAHFRLETLLGVSFAVTVIRWLVVWRARSAGVVIGVQVLHGLTFGLFWITGLAMLNDYVPKQLRATGQALFLAAMFGCGSLTGYHATGLILQTTHQVGPAFLAAGLLELLPLGLLLWGSRALRQPRPASTAAPPPTSP